MDFDHNLVLENGAENIETIEAYKKHLSQNDTVFVVTSRYESSESNNEIRTFLKKHDLKAKGIFHTNGQYKIETLKTLQSDLHYDDDPQELNLCSKEGIKNINTFNEKLWNEYLISL